MKAMTARVLVTERHPVTCWGISRLIHEQDGLEVIGEAVRMTRALVPDVVIIGRADPDEHGLPLARQLRDRYDDLRIGARRARRAELVAVPGAA